MLTPFTDVYLRILMFTPVMSCLPVFNRAFFTYVYPSLLLFIYVYTSLPKLTTISSWLPMFTRVYIIFICFVVFTYF